jgi:lysine 6-dehydrogenase
MRIAVVGGAGGMGRITCTDLARSGDVERVVIVDRDEARARELASALGPKAALGEPNAGLAAALEGADAVVNAASHALNMEVMRACLELGAHYTDLGGLFHVAINQYSLDGSFAENGLSAAISMGSAPGVTNMLAAACVAELETVESIEIADAIIPGRAPEPTQPYVPPYAASTLVDEFTAPAAVFLDGETRMVPADSGAKVYEYPEAAVECVHTIHSEPATLPRSYADRGIRRVEWRLGLPPLDVMRLRSFTAGGLTSTDPIEVRGTTVVPRDVLVAVLARQGGAEPDPAMVEYLRVIVEGTRGRSRAELVAEMRIAAREEWGNDISYGTGVPPSVAAQMLCRGEALRPGVGGPEAMLPVERFFADLARRGLEGTLSERSESRPLA